MSEQQQTVEGYFLSPQQMAAWRTGDAPVTRISLRFHGPITPGGIERALLSVVQKHEILRTTFPMARDIGIPIQVVGEEPSFEWSVGTASPESSPAARLHLAMPALVADTSTAEVLAFELAAALSNGDGTTDSEPVAQYAQYAEYLNQWLEDEEGKAAAELWRNAVSLPCPAIPFFRDSDKTQIESIEISLNPNAAGLLDEMARREDVRPEAIFFGCWVNVLAHVCGQYEATVAIETSGRTLEETVRMPGRFERCLPLAVSVQSTEPFLDLCRRCDSEWQSALQKEDAVPDSGQNAKVRFAMHDFRAVASAGDVKVEVEDAFSPMLPLDLRLTILYMPASLRLRLDYNAAAMDAADARLLAGYFEHALTQILQRPTSPLRACDLLSAAERSRIVNQWNRTERDLLDNRPFPFIFDEKAASSPDHPALQDGSNTLRYGDLARISNHYARILRERGIGPEHVVGVTAVPCIESIIGILAILKTGAAFLPIDPEYPAERNRWMLEQSQCRIILHRSGEEDLFPKDICVLVPVDISVVENNQPPLPPASIDPLNAAYIIYTSGSTGRPKGVVISHGALTNYLDWCCREYAGTAPNGALHSSLAFDLSITSALTPLLQGKTLHLPGGTTRADALASLLNRDVFYSWLKLTPSHARIVPQQARDGALASAETLILGGEGLLGRDLAAWIRQRPDARIINEYGPTEATVGCTVFDTEAAALGDGPVAIGKPIANTRIYILDDNLEPAPVGGCGEICISGAGLARGYLGRPDFTASRFVPDPHSPQPGARLYRTGDRGRLRPDGVLECLGRRDDQIKIRGFRVEPREVEAVLAQHPSIREAVVLPEPGKDGLRLTAFVVPVTESTSDIRISEFRDFLAGFLPEYMIPQTFITLEELPVTPNGKVDRNALLSSKPAANRPGGYAGPRTLEEEVLVTIWAKVLDLDRVGIDDNYFLLGGDSIRAIQIAGLAASADLNVTLNMVFQSQTIRDLAATLSQNAAPLPSPTIPYSLISTDDRKLLPEDAEDAYGLSRLQAGMVFERQLHADSAIYHDVFSHHLRLPLDTEKLRQAVEKLVERHPMLRTSFHLDGFSEPLQIVHRTAAPPITFEDLSALPPEEQRAKVQQWIDKEKEHGFDYSQPPLLRFRAHKTSPETFYFSLSFHHAILDGWSDATMLVELGLSYYRLLNGKPIDLEPPATPYRDFIAAERATLNGNTQLDYWLKLLDGATPTVLPRWTAGTVDDHRRGVRLQRVPIGADRSKALREFARELAVPLKSVLLAAHLRVLSAVGATDDVLTTISSSGRLETADGDRTIGLHINSTPLRLRLAGGRWIDLVRAAFDAERNSLPYRRYPMVDAQRHLGMRRLSETSFYYTHYHVLGNLKELPTFEILDQLAYEETSFALVANFDLNPNTGEISLTLAYDRTQFPSQQMELLAAYYEHALAAIAADPFAHYERVSLCSPGERELLLAYSGSQERQPDAGASPVSLFEDCARQSPESVALVSGGARVTYGELNAQANRLARYLRRIGVGPEVRVALYFDRSAAMIVSILGVLKAGGAYIPMEPANTNERTRAILADSKPLLILTTTKHLHDLPAAEKVVAVDSEPGIEQEAGTNVEQLASASNVAYIIYTSGSTGVPKGTLVTRSNLLHSTEARFRYYGAAPERFLLLSSYAFDSSVAGIFWTLCTGCTLVLPENDDHRDPTAISSLMRTERVSHLLALPSLYSALLESVAGQAAEHPLKAAIVAGQACPASVVQRHYGLFPSARLYNEYGPTEATVWSTVEECRPEEQNVAIGKPVPYTRAYVLDRECQLCPLGAPGEFYIGGAGITRGYLNQPGLTAERFVPDPFATDPGGRMYRTGDRVRFRQDGRLDYLGRVDWQIKIRGYRLEPEEVEAALKSLPEVRDAAVAAKSGPSGEARLAAYIVWSDSTAPNPVSLRAELERFLPAYMIPADFLFLDDLPRSANGKLNRRALPDPQIHEGTPQRDYVPPRTETERILAEIWGQVLHVEKAGITDDFFELGGDSILSIQIIARAKAAGIRIMPAQLFQQRTIQNLARLIEQQPSLSSTAPSDNASLSKQEIEDVMEQLTRQQGA